MRRLARLLFLAFSALASTSLAFDPARMRGDTSLLLPRYDFGRCGLARTDVDGDGVPEVVVGSQTDWTVLGVGTSGILDRVVSSRPFGGDTCRLLRVADADGDGADDVIAVVSPESSRPNEVVVLDLRTGATKGRFTVPVSGPYVRIPTDLLVKNAEGDPRAEIFVLDPQDLWMARIGEGVVWTFPGAGGTSMGLGNIDSDDDQELVVAGGVGVTGTVLEPAHRRREWVYTPGFGANVAVADVDGDGVAEIIAGGKGSVSRIDGSSRAVVWVTRLWSSDAVSGVRVDTLTGDPTVWLIATDRYDWQVLDGETGVPGISGFSPCCLNTGPPFLLLDLGHCTPGIVSVSGPWLVFSLFGGSGVLAGPEPVNVEGIQTAWMASGPILGDGRSRLLWSAYPGGLGLRDLHHDVDDYRRKPVSGQSFYGPLAAAQLDSDPALEVAVPEHSVWGRVSVLDGLTGQVEWSTGVLFGEVTSLAFGELPGAIPVLAVASGPGLVRLYDGAGGVLLWTSDPLGSAPVITFADVDGDLSPEILVAGWQGVVSLESATGRQLWALTLAGVSAIAAGSVSGAATPDIVVGTPGGAYAAYDGRTRTLLFRSTLEAGKKINAIRVADVDGDGTPELVIAYDDVYSSYGAKAGSVVVVRPADQAVLWRSPKLAEAQGLIVGDVDDDGKIEIVVATLKGLIAYEYDAGVPDSDPPVWNGPAGPRSALVLTDACCSAVELRWGVALDAASPPVRYRVYRGPVGFTPSPGDRIAEVSGSTHVDRTFSTSGLCEYVVRAVDRLGNEDANAVRVSVQPGPLASVRIEPLDPTICPKDRDRVTFRVIATGLSRVVDYRWYRNGQFFGFGDSLTSYGAGVYSCVANVEFCPELLASSRLTVTGVPGDASGDCVFAFDDLAALASGPNYAGGYARYLDVNGDGQLDSLDLDYLTDHFLGDGPPPVN